MTAIVRAALYETIRKANEGYSRRIGAVEGGGGGREVGERNRKLKSARKKADFNLINKRTQRKN